MLIDTWSVQMNLNQLDLLSIYINKYTEKYTENIDTLDELFQNWKMEKNFKYVAYICMHICLVILASIV